MRLTLKNDADKITWVKKLVIDMISQFYKFNLIKITNIINVFSQSETNRVSENKLK